VTTEDAAVGSGAWLHRNRTWLASIPLALVAAAMAGFRYPFASRAWEVAWSCGSAVVAATGVAARALVSGFVPPGTSGRSTRRLRAAALNTTGLYSVVRHPLYLGNLLFWLGVSLYPRVAWLPPVVLLYWWTVYERIAAAEERFLLATFDDSFVVWAARTPAFLPRPRLWRRPERPWSWPRMLRRERSTIAGAFLVFAGLELAAESVAHRALRAGPVPLALAACGALAYVGTMRIRA